jgi:hypothetical protein
LIACPNFFVTAQLDKALVAHHAAQAALSAIASETKAQRDSTELELQHSQQVVAQEKAKCAAAQAATANAHLQIESLEASLQALQQQVLNPEPLTPNPTTAFPCSAALFPRVTFWRSCRHRKAMCARFRTPSATVTTQLRRIGKKGRCCRCDIVCEKLCDIVCEKLRQPRACG